MGGEEKEVGGDLGGSVSTLFALLDEEGEGWAKRAVKVGMMEEGRKKDNQKTRSEEGSENKDKSYKPMR